VRSLVTSKNVSWPRLIWATLYVRSNISDAVRRHLRAAMSFVWMDMIYTLFVPWTIHTMYGPFVPSTILIISVAL